MAFRNGISVRERIACSAARPRSREVLEFDLHQSGSLEILVPRRYGQLVTPTGTRTPSNRVKTVDEILATISNEKHRRIFELLVREWQESGYVVKPGTVGASFQAK